MYIILEFNDKNETIHLNKINNSTYSRWLEYPGSLFAHSEKK